MVLKDIENVNNNTIINAYYTVADPGFPVGGVPTSDMYTFWQKHIQK